MAIARSASLPRSFTEGQLLTLQRRHSRTHGHRQYSERPLVLALVVATEQLVFGNGFGIEKETVHEVEVLRVRRSDTTAIACFALFFQQTESSG